MKYPTIPGILWNLHKQVPYGIQVCQDLRRYMDYATQSSRVGARVPYSMLEVPLLAAIYYHFVGDAIWLRQLVCPWHLSSGHTCPERSGKT